MTKNHNRTGLSPIESVSVIALLAILASFGVPKLMSTRPLSNELAAMATLRGLAASEAQIQGLGAIDTDSDGDGEYAYLSELAGRAKLRVARDGTSRSARYDGRLTPAMLSTAFGRVDGRGVLARSGYNFAIFLPASGSTPVGLSEVNLGGGSVGSRNAEKLWCAYAWPRVFGHSGQRAFFINQDGAMLQTSNNGAAGKLQYHGTEVRPAYSSAYSAASMRSAVASGAVGSDGNTWVPAR